MHSKNGHRHPRALAVITPDGIMRGLESNVTDVINRSGFEIVTRRRFPISLRDANFLLQAVDAPEARKMRHVKFLMQMPVELMLVEGPEAPRELQKIARQIRERHSVSIPFFPEFDLEHHIILHTSRPSRADHEVHYFTNVRHLLRFSER
jgi:nucleoside diphosphate kinase